MAWFVDQSFLHCLLGPKRVQINSYHNLCILFLLMKQWFWFCASRCTPHLGEMHSAVLFKILIAPQISLSILPPAPLHDLQCFLQLFRLCCGSWFQISSDLQFSQRWSLHFFFHSPCCFGVSETRRVECQVYSATLNLEVLSMSNFLLQPGLLSSYDFQSPIMWICFPIYAVYMLVTSNLSLTR